MKKLYWFFGIYLIVYLSIWIFLIFPMVLESERLRDKIEKQEKYIEYLNKMPL